MHLHPPQGDVTAGDTGDVTADDAGDGVPKEEGETPADAVKTEDAIVATEAEGHDVDASNTSSSNQPADTAKAADDEGDVTAGDAGDVTAGDAGDSVPKEEGETPADAVKTEDATATAEVYHVGDSVELYTGYDSLAASYDADA